MVHLGDLTKINGAEIEPVDVITFGSPYQDLSVAGKRAGLEGERSGLFMEAVRIIREMKEATYGVYPRFAVWENVPGAFSSHQGQDFRAVLEEIGDAQIPMPESGQWATAGMVRTEECEIAWRTLDAQYWGVPQRRRRIFLVADFGGQCASEILFIEPCLRGDSQESGKEGQGVARDAETVVDVPIWDIGDRRRVLESVNVAPALLSKMGTGGNNVPIIPRTTNKICGCLSCGAHPGGFNGQEAYNDQLIIEPRSQDGVCRVHHDVVPTLNTAGGGQRQPCVMAVDCRNLIRIRRLTPLECTRLQGFPDDWLDIEGMSDTAKYKAIGNSVAVPCVEFVMAGIAKKLRGESV